MLPSKPANAFAARACRHAARHGSRQPRLSRRPRTPPRHARQPEPAAGRQVQFIKTVTGSRSMRAGPLLEPVSAPGPGPGDGPGSGVDSSALTPRAGPTQPSVLGEQGTGGTGDRVRAKQGPPSYRQGSAPRAGLTRPAPSPSSGLIQTHGFAGQHLPGGGARLLVPPPLRPRRLRRQPRTLPPPPQSESQAAVA